MDSGRKIVCLSIAILGAVVSLGLLGCQSPRNDIEAFVKPYEVDATSASYILRPPDGLEVFCGKIPEIHQQAQQIRPDGKVTFEGLGELHVAGKTASEVAGMIQERATKLYALQGDYPIDVRVKPMASKVYYVLGEVRRPGPKAYTGYDTVLKAVSGAVPEVTGWLKRIRVIRPSGQEGVESKIFEMDLKTILKTGDASRNVLLEEGDIVYVPPTPLAAVAMVIEEFVRPIGRAMTPISSYYYISNLSDN